MTTMFAAVKLFIFYFLIKCVEVKVVPLVEQIPEVDVPDLGTVEGFVTYSQFRNRPIYNFMGINYAESPSGPLRFLPPVPFGPRNITYDATKFRQRCPQIDHTYYPSPNASQIDNRTDIEDCLVVNVFTPKIPSDAVTADLPVLYFIHGGSFYFGSAYDFTGEFLLDDDIVLVVVQYRLGPLGFLSLQTEDIPGNVGILDMIEGLKWVQKNIGYFGGNASRVTIDGQSAGAAAVSALLISPLAEGLFQQAIIQSGAALGTWAVDDRPVEVATTIARLAGCNTTSLLTITECFMELPAMEIVKAHSWFISEDIQKGGLGIGGNGLTIQTAGTVQFLTESPHKLYSEGKFLKVPIMGGVTRDEGSAFLANVYDLKFQSSEPSFFKRNATRDVLWFCGIGDTTGSVTDVFQKQYFETEQLGSFDSMVPGFMDMIGVVLLKSSTFSVLRLMSTFQPTYVYSFNYYGNVSKLRYSLPNWDDEYPFPSGVAHSDELGYLFPNIYVTYRQEELDITKTMVGLWTTFIKTGSPTPTSQVANWPQLVPEDGPYLRIGKKCEVKNDFIEEYFVATKEGFLNSSVTPQISSMVVLINILLVFYRNFI